MVHHGTCPICDSGNISHYLRCRDHFLTGEDFNLEKCSSCGFIFTQDHPDEENSGKYYESDKYASHNDNKGISGILYNLSREIMLREKLRLIRKITGLRTGRLLDIGSGSGHFLSVMKNSGWDTTGIEINEKARKRSVEKFGLKVLEPGLLNALEQESFDCITLWHVLEHFQDPFKYASEIKRLLRPGGICIAAMPNSSSCDALHFGPFWAAYDVPRHLWHFNSDTFIKFSAKAGLKITGIHSLPLDIFYISMLSEKYKASKTHFISGILKGGLFSFRTLFNKYKSSSLVYLLRK